MALIGFNQLGKSIHDEGKFHYQYLFKPTIPAQTTAGYFVDTNQSSGIPKYNPFAGSELTATPLIGAGNAGIYPGNFISGKSKYLLRMQIQHLNASTPSVIYLNDYLSFYPLIDCDNLDPQDMVNVEPLPRYANGRGVRIVLIASAPMALTAPVNITYTNSNGVSGRTSTANVIPASSIGVCATAMGTQGLSSNATPFWPLASGDTGVRSIESIQFGSGAGGFMIACLVKPIASLGIYEANVIAEKNYGFDQALPPEILEGAYLNLLVQNATTTTGNLRGEFIFINT